MPLPSAVVSGGHLADVVEATPAAQGRLVLVVDSLPAWPSAGDEVVLVHPDGTERQATVVESDQARGIVVVEPHG